MVDGMYESFVMESLQNGMIEKLYLVYIRPIFEYASEVWDNCGSVNASKLERLQLEAARIVTGLPVFANSNFICLTISLVDF
jgi:hypothetical protein